MLFYRVSGEILNMSQNNTQMSPPSSPPSSPRPDVVVRFFRNCVLQLPESGPSKVEHPVHGLTVTNFSRPMNNHWMVTGATVPLGALAPIVVVLPPNSVGGDGINLAYPLIHNLKNLPVGTQPPIPSKTAKFLIKVISKIMKAVQDNECDWVPEWHSNHGRTANEDLLDVTTSFTALVPGEMIPEQLRCLRTWMVYKFIENCMRQWYRTYEVCKKGTQNKTRFRVAFCEGIPDEQVDTLMNIYETSVKELNCEATEKVEAKKRKKERIEEAKKKASALKIYTKNQLEYTGEALFKREKEFLDLQAKIAALHRARNISLHQRAAFLLPLVCKSLWDIYKECDDIEGELVFTRPSNKTSQVVAALQYARYKSNNV